MLRTSIIVAVCAYSVAAQAQSAAQAEVLFREGRKLMEAGKLAEACEAFEQSQKLDPATTTLLNLAGCREKNGQIATAWGLFLDAERQTRSASDAATQKLHEVAVDHAHKLEARVSKLTIEVPPASKLEGLEITRDKERIDPVMWNRALPVDGGTFTVTARAPNVDAWSTRVTVAREGDNKVVDVPNLRDPKPSHAEPPPPRQPPPPPPVAHPAREASPPEEEAPARDQTVHHSKLVPLALGAGALGLFAGGLAFELSGESTYNDAKAELTDQARRDSLYDSANHKRYLAEGLAVAGIGCAGLAVWLYLRDRRADPDRAALVVSPHGFGIAGSF